MSEFNEKRLQVGAELLDAISKQLADASYPRDVRTLAEAYALTIGNVTSVGHTEVRS